MTGGVFGSCYRNDCDGQLEVWSPVGDYACSECSVAGSIMNFNPETDLQDTHDAQYKHPR